MSREKIDDIIFRLQIASIPLGKKAENAVSDITWYINTGRASCDYLRALCALSKYRVNTLVRKISACGCTDDVIAASKKYLKIQ